MLKVNQLIGFGKRRASGGAISTFTLIADNFASAASVTAPSGIEAGDLLVFTDRCINFSLPTIVIPSGFTQIAETNLVSQERAVTSYKIADGTEDSATLTGMDGLEEQKLIAQYRADLPITGVTIGGLVTSASTGNPSAISVTASAGMPPLVVFGAYHSSAAVDPRTFTPAKDGETDAGTSLYLAHKLYTSSPANVSCDMDDEGSTNNLHGWYFELES